MRFVCICGCKCGVDIGSETRNEMKSEKVLKRGRVIRHVGHENRKEVR